MHGRLTAVDHSREVLGQIAGVVKRELGALGDLGLAGHGVHGPLVVIGFRKVSGPEFDRNPR